MSRRWSRSDDGMASLVRAVMVWAAAVQRKTGEGSSQSTGSSRVTLAQFAAVHLHPATRAGAVCGMLMLV